MSDEVEIKIESDYSFDVFISYAHQDILFARDLATWMREARLKVWLDEEQLVPGTRFRSGLQQGLRESRSLVSVMTREYSKRRWTQREIDLFDILADDEQRKVIGIVIEEFGETPLDQVFIVNHRIKWNSINFDGSAFWQLFCGLKGKSPGPNSEWQKKGEKLIKKEERENYNPILFDYVLQPPQNKFNKLIQACLLSEEYNWMDYFIELRKSIADEEYNDDLIEKLLIEPWGRGAYWIAATVSLAILPKIIKQYSVWPFIDAGLVNVVRWFMASFNVLQPFSSEITFSWAVLEETWPFLLDAAKRTENELVQDHFGKIAHAAIDKNLRFKQFEDNYNYGVMITPWNHFHLSWLALRLDDQKSAKSHAEALFRIASSGDKRAGRFVARVANWPCFTQLRKDKDFLSFLCKSTASSWNKEENEGLDFIFYMQNIDDVPKYVLHERLKMIWEFCLSQLKNNSFKSST